MKKAALTAGFVVFLGAFAQASVVYSFTGTYGGPPVSFTLTVPSAVLADASFVPGPQLVCDACDQINFFVDAVAHGFTSTPSNAVGYNVSNNGQFLFFFAPTSFTVDGVYTDVIGGGFPDQGTLTVTGASSVPEPSSVALLGTGLVGLAAVVRRRLMLLPPVEPF